MTRYGGLTPSLYTGAMTFSVPLYTYEDPDFNIPVTLVYNFDGYRPAQHSGSVGYGWAMDCGGVITREVRGIPDEGDLDDGRNYSCNVHGWRQAAPAYRVSPSMDYSSIYSMHRLNQRHISSDQCVSGLLASDIFSDTPGFCVESGGGAFFDVYDTSPDLFHFRFLGHSGDFMMLNDGSVRVFNSDFPHGEVSIVFNDVPQQPERCSITIQTGDGYSYAFQPDTPSVCHKTLSDIRRPQRSLTSWHLSTITAPNGRTAQFSYEACSVVSINQYYENLRDGAYNCTSIYECYCTNGNIYTSFNDDLWTAVTETCPMLSSISIPGCGMISFSYAHAPYNENGRDCLTCPDALGQYISGPQKLLKSVIVESIGSGSAHSRDTVDYAVLEHQFAPSGTPKAFLRAVTTLHGGRHSFSYNLSGYTLPHNNTRSTDHWGYWNGSADDDLRLHLTNVSGGHYEYQRHTIQGDRPDSTITWIDTVWVTHTASHLYDQMTDDSSEAATHFAACGALISINYPTGGSTLVRYNGNSVSRRLNMHRFDRAATLEQVDSTDASATWTVGGVRIAGLTDIVPVNGSDGRADSLVTTFDYGPGILTHMPKYSEKVSYFHRADSYYGTACNMLINETGFNGCCSNRMSLGFHIAYPSVTCIHPDGSSTGHSFTSVADSGLLDGHSNGWPVPKHALCNEDWFECEGMVPGCLAPVTYDRSALRGLTKSIVERDADGCVRERHDFHYNHVPAVQTTICFNDFFTYRVATFVADTPQTVTVTRSKNSEAMRTMNVFNGLGQLTESSVVSGSVDCGEVLWHADTLRTRYRYLHEDHPEALPCALSDAVRTRADASGEWVIDSEHRSYPDSLHSILPERILSYTPGIPVRLSSGDNPFVKGRNHARVTAFEYSDMLRPTTVTLPGNEAVTYVWNGNIIVSMTENGSANRTAFSWKDLVGLSGMTPPSGASESYTYDAHNRLKSVMDRDSRTVSAYDYHLEN